MDKKINSASPRTGWCMLGLGSTQKHRERKMNNYMKNAIRPIVLATALALSAPAYAGIDNVTPLANALTIQGASFNQKKDQLQRFLSGYTRRLQDSGYSDNTIVGCLPPNVAPGNYD